MGFGALLILILVVAIISALRLYENNELTATTGHRQDITAMVGEWEKLHTVNNVRTIAVAALEGVNPDLVASLKKDMATNVKLISSLQKQVDENIRDPRARELFDTIIARRQAYVDARAAAQKAQAEGRTQQAEQFFKHDMPTYLGAYSQSIHALLQYQNEAGRAAIQTLQNSNRAGILTVAVTSAIAFLIGLLYAWRLLVSITRPLAETVGLARAVADRNLTQAIEPKGKDEIADLERTLQEMSSGLRQTVAELQSSAGSVASAAGQIATGNEDLASRTEEQASSLAQTAAAMEQITATVRQNAGSAQQANTLTASAVQTAHDGARAVGELVQTMGEINAKSQQVMDIVGVIDSIAFQTNILALNAAVEAARAGEQGKGFAVVASEVRALAQRSATSAKEIKGLIDASATAIGKGGEQATRAGDTMQHIDDAVSKVTDIVEQISTASNEQTSGIEQINAALTQMNDVTHQNASLVEESTAAAQSMREQAAVLARLVAGFKTGAEARPAPALRTIANGGVNALAQQASAREARAVVRRAAARLPDGRRGNQPRLGAKSAQTADEADWATF